VWAKKIPNEAVELKMTADKDGKVEITIGANQIAFRLQANEELDTGLLRISGDEVMIKVFADSTLTDECTIPVRDIATEYKRFCYDESPPVVRVSRSPSPNSYGWNNSNVTITVTAEDEEGGSGIKAIYYKIGTENPVEVDADESTPSEGGRVASYSRELSDEGIHKLGFWAVDQAENECDHQALTVRIDKTKPSISVSPSSGTFTESITMRWSVDDNLSGVAECRVLMNSSRVSSNCSGSRSLGGGSHSVRVEAEDKAGNSDYEPRSYTISQPNQPPRADPGGPYHEECQGQGCYATVWLDGSDSYDPDGHITSYYWDFGDGSSGSGRTTSHSYRARGEVGSTISPYRACLTVTDDDGATDKEYTDIYIYYRPKAKYTVCPSGCPYRSIQSAVDGSSTGAIITVGPGEYSEGIVIDKDIILKGVSRDEVRLRGYITIEENAGATVSIEGMTVTDSRGDGAFVVQGGHNTLTVTSCIISDNVTGVFVAEGSAALIENNVMSYNLYAIIVRGYANIIDNRIEYNEGFGIWVRGNGRINQEGNEFRGNDIENIYYD